MNDAVIVDSGVANLASIAGALWRLDATVVVTADPTVVRDATRIVLPGVGAFGAGMAALRSSGLDVAIREAASRGTSLLGICLGMQLLCEGSDEAPGVAGLGLVEGTCRRLPPDVRVPHLGWNTVTPAPEARFVSNGVAAFANSYALHESPEGWTAAWTTHGVAFVAAACSLVFVFAAARTVVAKAKRTMAASCFIQSPSHESMLSRIGHALVGPSPEHELVTSTRSWRIPSTSFRVSAPGARRWPCPPLQASLPKWCRPTMPAIRLAGARVRRS